MCTWCIWILLRKSSCDCWECGPALQRRLNGELKASFDLSIIIYLPYRSEGIERWFEFPKKKKLTSAWVIFKFILSKSSWLAESLSVKKKVLQEIQIQQTVAMFCQKDRWTAPKRYRTLRGSEIDTYHRAHTHVWFALAHTFQMWGKLNRISFFNFLRSLPGKIGMIDDDGIVRCVSAGRLLRWLSAFARKNPLRFHLSDQKQDLSQGGR